MYKPYLIDYPELYTTLQLFCMELNMDVYGSGSDSDIYELECMRRDGFIPYSHNRGGFDVINYLSSEYDSDSDDGSDDNENCYYLMLHGFRFIYEGTENGKHILCGYYSTWSEHNIYGINKTPIIAEVEIRFSTIEQLIAKLNKFVKEQAIKVA
jgi:hypothetical protein